MSRIADSLRKPVTWSEIEGVSVISHPDDAVEELLIDASVRLDELEGILADIMQYDLRDILPASLIARIEKTHLA